MPFPDLTILAVITGAFLSIPSIKTRAPVLSEEMPTHPVIIMTVRVITFYYILPGRSRPDMWNG
jgi:hypothetical protein